MTLKNKIAITFTFITSVILIGICLLIYWLSANYTRNEFLLRLRDRAGIAAAFRLEEDELSQRLYSELSRKYMQSLSGEQEYFVPLDGAPMPSNLPIFLEARFIEQIRNEGFATKLVDTLSVAGIRYEDNEGIFAVIISAKDEFGIRKLTNLSRILIIIILCYLFLVLFIGRWYAREVLSPLNDIICQMRAIDSAHLHVRLAENDKRDELSQLAHTFNNLLNRIETAIETQQQFINNASHELKNPLTAILGEIEIVLRQERSPEEYRRALQHLEKEADRLKNLTLRLLKLAQTKLAERVDNQNTLRIDELILEVVEELNEVAAPGIIKLSFSAMPEDAQMLEIRADANLLRIAFANVIENAIKFSSSSSVSVHFECSQQQFCLQVTDVGIGIPPEEVNNIFSPFYRADNALQFPGFGMGLSLVKKIMDIHEGAIDVKSQPGQGTTITLRLPRQ